MSRLFTPFVVFAALASGCANLGGNNAPVDTSVPSVNSGDFCWLDADGDGATGTMVSYTDAMPAGCGTIANDCDDADRNIQTGCSGAGAIPGGDDQSQPWDGLASDGVFITSLDGQPAYIVGSALAADLANTQFATAGGTGEEAYFFIPDEVTPGRANPAQDLSLYGYGLGGMVDWQVSLIALVPAYNTDLQFVGFGQAVTPGIYRVNCAATGLLGDDVIDNWCNLEVLQRSSDYLLTFQECGQVKQSICFQVDDGDVFESEADCLGLYDSPCDGDPDFNGDDTIDDEPEPTPTVQCYTDLDNDNHGVGFLSEHAGTNCGQGLASVAGDCNDSSASAYPGAVEVVNDGLDNDCDGQVDEGAGVTCYSDDDRDTYGDVVITPADGDCVDAGEATRSGDCNDTNSTVNPSVSEILGNAVDENCDGVVDQNGDQANGTVTIQVTLDPATPAGTREYWVYNETDATGGWSATPCARTSLNTATCTVNGGSGDVIRLNGEIGTHNGNDQWFWYANAADWISSVVVNGASMTVSTSVVTNPVAGYVRPRDNGAGGYNGVLVVP